MARHSQPWPSGNGRPTRHLAASPGLSKLVLAMQAVPRLARPRMLAAASSSVCSCATPQLECLRFKIFKIFTDV